MIKCLFKKLKSLGLALLMAVMLNLPLWNSALASMPNSSVQNSEPTTLTDGTVLKKTVEPVAGMINKWKVTLRVEAKKTTKKSDIVLVIDTSGSMKDNRRMKEAKRAAKNFVNQLLDADHPNTRIALVPFETDIYLKDFTNYTGKQDLLDTIDHLRAYGGTFTQGGIKMAASSLSNSQADFKNMVLLSDGVPTYNYAINEPSNYFVDGGPNSHFHEKETGPVVPKEAFNYKKRAGDGRNMWNFIDKVWVEKYWEHHYYNSGNCAIAEASFAKQDGVKIHTVAVNATQRGNNVLKQIATSPDDAYKTNDPAQLNTIFNKIATQIESAVQDATITDVMGEGVVAVKSGANTTLSDGGKKLVWKLGTPTQQEGDKFVAETSYEIELDQGILNAAADNGFYSANAEAKITYNGNQTGLFPVPKIKPTLVKLAKKLTGQTCYDCQFKIALKKSGSILDLEEHLIGAGETKTLYHPMEVGTYEAEEVGTSNNPVDFSHYRIEYTSKQFNLAQAGPDQTVIIENIYETTSVHVKKRWNGKAESSATINLLSNGKKINQVELNEVNNWKHTFSNLPKNEGGQEIVYTVTENSIENYKTNITETSKNNFTVTNTYVSPKTDITATKKWVNGPAPVLIQFQLYRQIAGGEEQKVGSPVDLQPGTLAYTWKDMPVTDEKGNTYIYSVKEVTELSNFSASYDGQSKLNIVNTYSVPKDKVTATKKWIGGEKANNGLRPTVWFKLYRQIKDGALEAVPGASVKKVVSDKATWNNIDQTDINGNKYTFTVKEVDADGNDFTPENYIKKEDGLMVTNTYVSPKITIGVVKQWVDEFDQHQSITAELVRDGVVFKRIKLNDQNHWQHIWEVDQTDSDGKKYVYQVREADLPDNYRTLIEGDMTTGFLIKNIWNKPTTELPEADWKLPNTGYQTRTNITELLAVIMMAGFSVYHLRRIREL